MDGEGERGSSAVLEQSQPNRLVDAGEGAAPAAASAPSSDEVRNPLHEDGAPPEH